MLIKIYSIRQSKVKSGNFPGAGPKSFLTHCVLCVTVRWLFKKNVGERREFCIHEKRFGGGIGRIDPRVDDGVCGMREERS